MLVTLAAGTLRAREIRKQCRHCASRAVAVSQQLASLAPSGQRYGWDLIVWVGLARYHRHLQREEIRTALARQGLSLSAGPVSALCDRFLAALETLHWHRAPALRAALPHGYPLHIDATCDKGRGGAFRCLDGWTGWVLHAVRIGSENERELRPAVERTVAAFGDPVAIMRDLGQAGAKAVAGCRQRGVPDLLCPYHFLAAVGHRLLDGGYALLRSQISRSKVRGRLRALLRAARSDESRRAGPPAAAAPLALRAPPAEAGCRGPRRARAAGRCSARCGTCCACPTRNCRAGRGRPLPPRSSPRPPPPGCKPSPLTSGATTRTCAGWPPTGRERSSPSPSCSAIWTATARAWSAIPSPAMRRAGLWRSSTVPTMSSSIMPSPGLFRVDLGSSKQLHLFSCCYENRGGRRLGIITPVSRTDENPPQPLPRVHPPVHHHHAWSRRPD